MIPDYNETIVNIATAPGEAGVSVVRLSGDQAVEISKFFFKAKYFTDLEKVPSRYMAYGWVEEKGKSIDEALLCIMRGPNSYTAEDVVEIQCHGGSYIAQTILHLALEKGARLSKPGEFAQRAFLNGRIDLTQAEATNDLIKTKTSLGLNIVVNQLKGKLYQRILDIKKEIAWVLALVNANIDFPEEDVVFTHIDKVKQKLQFSIDAVRTLIHSADVGIIIREGYKLVLAGHPNVGKSSVLNGLLNESRSIVTKIPGTTRDTIEESCNINGIPISIIDTAGIHETDDVVEQEGIHRTFEAIKKADLILYIVDVSCPEESAEIPENITTGEAPVLVVYNKKDLVEVETFKGESRLNKMDHILISAKDKDGIEPLREKIFTYISGKTGSIGEDTMLTNLRQKMAAEQALNDLLIVQEAVELGAGEEMISFDLTKAINALGEIVGETTPDDMLNEIFSNFCIGK